MVRSTDDITICIATSQDAQRLSLLFDDYRQFYNQPSNIQDAFLFLEERLLKSESYIFYAENKNKQILGFVQLYPSFSSVSLKKLWILNDLFVTPAARRQSVAKKLLQFTEKFSIQSQAKGLTLKTAIDNLNAQSLYKSLGWKHNEKFQTFDLIHYQS